MGVESHFCSVSVCLPLSFSNCIHITHTLCECTYMYVYRLMLPSLCPAQQGLGKGGARNGDGGVTGGKYFLEGTQRTAGGMN